MADSRTDELYVPLNEVELDARVDQFLATARMDDPEKCALVCSKYPVKSRRQMRTLAEREIPVGLYPGVLAAAGYPVVGGIEPTPVEYLRHRRILPPGVEVSA